MRKGILVAFSVCIMAVGIVGISYADFTSNGTIYACVNNSTGTLSIVDTATATKPYCGSLSKQTLVMFQAAAGMEKVMYGRITSYGGQFDQGNNGYAVAHYQPGSGTYYITFNTFSNTALPTCMATSSTAQCKVTDKTYGGVTINCLAPTISGAGTAGESISWAPADTDFDFMCVD